MNHKMLNSFAQNQHQISDKLMFFCLNDCFTWLIGTLVIPALVCMLNHLRHVWLFATPWTVSHQAPLPMGFSRQNTKLGCHSLLQGIFLTWGSNLGVRHCRQFLYHLSHKGSPNLGTNSWCATLPIKAHRQYIKHDGICWLLLTKIEILQV